MAKLLWSLICGMSLSIAGVAGARPQGWEDGSRTNTPSKVSLSSPSKSRSSESFASLFSPSFDFGFMASAPESLGVEAQFRPHSLFSLWALYSWPLDLEIAVNVKSKKLVEEGGFAIRSPDLELPVQARIGPHRAAGVAFHPFRGSFFLSAGYEARTIDIQSEVESRLELIDGQGRALTNTVFRAYANTHTEQDILRMTIGNRWNFAYEKLYFSWFGGFVQPFGAGSRHNVDVKVLNPLASDPGDVVASNLKLAEEQQEILMSQRLDKELMKVERQILPVLGLGFGWHF